MKIIVCTPKFVRQNSLDYVYWNFVTPLRMMGHEVSVYDYTSDGMFDKWLLEYKKEGGLPDIVLSVATGHEGKEYYASMSELSNNTNVHTVNWFCDDSWRFEDFSKNVQSNFNVVVTTEKQYLHKYSTKSLYYTWPVEQSLYDMHKVNNFSDRKNYVAFYGGYTPYRSEFLERVSKEVPIVFPKSEFYEDIVNTLSNSKICINISDNRGTKQSKARVFEVAAAGCCVISEWYPDASEHFTNKEMLTFKTSGDLIFILKKLMEKPSMIEYLAANANKRFLEQYTSKTVLADLIEEITRGK